MLCCKNSSNDVITECLTVKKFMKTRFFVIKIYYNSTKNVPNIAYTENHIWGYIHYKRRQGKLITCIDNFIRRVFQDIAPRYQKLFSKIFYWVFPNNVFDMN